MNDSPNPDPVAEKIARIDARLEALEEKLQEIGRPAGLDPATARTIFDIASFWGPLVNGSTTAMAIAFAALGFGAAPLIPRWLTWLSMIFFLEQAIETVTVFGQSGFIAPGGAMNVYLGGVIGFLWVAGVVHWAMKRLDTGAAQPD